MVVAAPVLPLFCIANVIPLPGVAGQILLGSLSLLALFAAKGRHNQQTLPRPLF